MQSPMQSSQNKPKDYTVTIFVVVGLFILVLLLIAATV